MDIYIKKGVLEINIGSNLLWVTRKELIEFKHIGFKGFRNGKRDNSIIDQVLEDKKTVYASSYWDSVGGDLKIENSYHLRQYSPLHVTLPGTKCFIHEDIDYNKKGVSSNYVYSITAPCPFSRDYKSGRDRIEIFTYIHGEDFSGNTPQTILACDGCGVHSYLNEKDLHCLIEYSKERRVNKNILPFIYPNKDRKTFSAFCPGLS